MRVSVQQAIEMNPPSDAGASSDDAHSGGEEGHPFLGGAALRAAMESASASSLSLQASRESILAGVRRDSPPPAKPPPPAQSKADKLRAAVASWRPEGPPRPAGKKKKRRGERRSCAVCMGRLEEDLVALHCGHVFHARCARRALAAQAACPICREAATEADVRPVFL